MEKSTPTILLAEDSDDDGFFFERALKKACVPCSLVRARNGKAATDLLSGGPQGAIEPFLFFLDLKMPVMNGFDVLAWLGSAKIEVKPKVFVLSGSNDHADRTRALELGAADYLVKPITAEILRAKVTAELDALKVSPSVDTGASV